MVGARDAEERCRVLQSLVIKGHLNAASLEATALGSSLDMPVTKAPHILATLQPHLPG